MIRSHTTKVWKFDDCDYVAAETLDDALAWYKNETGVEVEEWEEASLDTKGYTGEVPGDGGETMTFAEMIRRAQEAKERFPQILGTDPYYA